MIGRWWRLHARYAAFKASADQWWKEVEDPAFAAYYRECAAVPHMRSATSFRIMGGGERFLDTENPADVNNARRLLADYPNGSVDPDFATYLKACSEVVRGADSREQMIARLAGKYGIDAICARSDRLGELVSEFETRLLDMPAPDHAALAWKLDHLLTPYGQEGDKSTAPWAEATVAQTLADYRRLLIGEA